MLKRLFSIITISLIITGSFFNAYSSINHVYADDDTDAWTQVTTNEQLVDAFKAYCKSRDVTIEGSLADGVTSFTTKTFNGLVNALGIDVNVLQANLKYQTDGNLGTRFLFNTLSIDAYNRIFAQFLQDNDLEVGDTVDDKNVYSGYFFVDADGNGCLVYRITTTGSSTNDAVINEYGTTYRYTGSDLYTSVQADATTHYININFLNNTTYDLRYRVKAYASNNISLEIGSGWYNMYQVYKGNVVHDGDLCVVHFDSDASSSYRNLNYIALYNTLDSSYGECSYFNLLKQIPVTNTGVDEANVYITTNNTTINNNTYEGDTIINNNGTTDDDDPVIPDPNPNPTPDPPTIPDDGGWQDFSLPEMPNDWLIYGMERKFPFDIPFNIMFALSLLNHEPEIPKFEGDIDLQVCTWHYDIDLTPFDDIATILRRFEVLAFIIGLAILTKELINWG